MSAFQQLERQWTFALTSIDVITDNCFFKKKKMNTKNCIQRLNNCVFVLASACICVVKALFKFTFKLSCHVFASSPCRRAKG